MAKILKNFEFKTGVGSQKHPWDEYLDGRIHQCGREDFGDIKLNTFGMMLRHRAMKRGKGVKVSIDTEAETVTFQAVEDPTAAERWEAFQQKTKERLARKKAEAAEANGEQTEEETTEEQEEETPAPKRRKK